MILEKYFIDPDGNVIHVTDTHISTVISDPERFSVTRDWINRVYDKHGEKIGSENKARAEILIQLFKDGFIRVRYDGKFDRWVFQMHTLTEKNKELLISFAQTALSKGIFGKKYYPHADVSVLDSNGRTVMESLFGDIGRCNHLTKE